MSGCPNQTTAGMVSVKVDPKDQQAGHGHQRPAPDGWSAFNVKPQPSELRLNLGEMGADRIVIEMAGAKPSCSADHAEIERLRAELSETQKKYEAISKEQQTVKRRCAAFIRQRACLLESLPGNRVDARKLREIGDELDLIQLPELPEGENAIPKKVTELTAQIAELEAQLAEARKLPVALLPEITPELYSEWMMETGGDSVTERWNIVLARHFRQAADPPHPTLDVEAVAREAREHYLNTPDNMNESVVKVLRRHCTDAPAQPLQKMQQFAPADETLAAAVARVEREARAKCAAMVREWGQTPFTPRSYELLADRMERGE